MSNLYKDAPIVKVVMLKGKDGAKSKLSELTNDMTFLTQEQITTLVNNIIDTGSVGDIDTGFVTRLVEQNKGKALKFWIGTQAEYNALATKTANTFYIITDDSFKTDVLAAINDLQAQINSIIQTDYETEISALQEATQGLNTRVQELEESPPSEMFFKTGDTGTDERVITSGYLSHDACELSFSIPLKKYLPADKDIDFGSEWQSNVTARIRQNGNYIFGQADFAQPLEYFYNDTATYGTKIRNRGFYLDVQYFNKTMGGDITSFDEGQNNAPVAIQLYLNYTIVDKEG